MRKPLYIPQQEPVTSNDIPTQLYKTLPTGASPLDMYEYVINIAPPRRSDDDLTPAPSTESKTIPYPFLKLNKTEIISDLDSILVEYLIQTKEDGDE